MDQEKISQDVFDESVAETMAKLAPFVAQVDALKEAFDKDKDVNKFVQGLAKIQKAMREATKVITEGVEGVPGGLKVAVCGVLGDVVK